MLKTWFIWSDAHIPFEDKKAFDLVLKIGRTLKPYGQIIIGDFGDMLSVSSHPKTPPQARWQLTDEVDAVNDRLDQLDALRCKRKHFFIGNHDSFGQKLAMKQAIGLFDSLDPRALYNLGKRGWISHEYQIPYKIGKVWFVHDTGFWGKNAIRQNGDAFGASTVQGHTHAAGVEYFGNALGERHVSATVGWLGDASYAKYMAAIKKTRNWQTAFGLMRVEPNGVSHVQVIPIISNKAVVDGILYT